MTNDNLETLSQEQVDEREAKALAEVARIQAFKEERRLAQHQGRVKEVLDLIEKYNLSVSDVFPHARLAEQTSATVGERAKRGRKQDDKQGPATVIFQNAEGQTWKGRGLPAGWLLEHIKSGGKLRELASPGLTWSGGLTRDTKTKANRRPKWVQMLLDEGISEDQLKAGLNKPN